MLMLSGTQILYAREEIQIKSRKLSKNYQYKHNVYL